MDFSTWLESNAEEDETARKLVDTLKSSNIKLPEKNESKKKLLKAIRKSKADDDTRTEMENWVAQLWIEYEKGIENSDDQLFMGKGGWACLFTFLLKNIRPLMTGAIAFSLVFFIGVALYRKDGFLHALSNVETARGLITFLFALGTIGIAIIIIISVFISELKSEESKERFYRAKEILTILIGILGTIVGFYFGSPETDSQAAGIELAAFQFSNQAPVAGEQLTMTTLASKGMPPYAYSLIVKKGEDIIKAFEEGKTDNGLIFHSIQLPEGDSGYQIHTELEVKDSGGKFAQKTGEKIEVKTPSQ